MKQARERTVSGGCRAAERRAAWGLAVLCVALACAIPALSTARAQAARIAVVTRHTISLRGALPMLLRAAFLPGGRLVIFSQRGGQNFVSLGIFSDKGTLLRKIAGTGVPTGLARLTSFRVDSHGTIWVSTLFPPEVARFNQKGLVSVSSLPKPKLAYALAVDGSRGYVYVSGCAPLHPGVGPGCLLVHQFEIEGMKPRKSFLQTDPSVLRNTQFGIQWVPIDVDARGIVWAVDSPALTLYSLNPTSDRVASHPIRSRIARPSGKLNPLGGGAYTRKYYESLFLPTCVIATQGRVLVSIRRPGGAGYLPCQAI